MDPLDVFSRPADGPDAVLRYAAHDDGLIDVFLPPSLGQPNTLRPLLVFIHGGFWRQEWDRQHARPLANALAHKGFVVAVPEYRRTGGSGGWPITATDVQRAVEVLPGMIDDIAPGWIDPRAPAIVSGHSAGGHLALWVGIRAAAGRVGRIVALAPVADLVYAARANLDGGAAQDLLGGTPDHVPHAYAEADPFAAPTAANRKIVVIHGTADRQVPVEMSRELSARYPAIDYVELDDVDHFALIDPLSAPFPTTVLPAISGHRGH